MTLGQKIKKLRGEKNLTQKDLADQVHVTFQTVSKWENDENEPDVTTLRELAKLFDCSLDYLLSEEEDQKEDKETPVVVAPVPEVKTVIVHQKELHVCEHCKKDIPEDELDMEDVMTRPAGRSSSAEYRKAYYHKSCLDQIKQERAIKAKEDRIRNIKRAKKLSFGWGIAGGIVALTISLLVFLLNEKCKANIHPALAVLFAVLIGYAIFADIYCIISGSYIGDVFESVSSWSIRMPGVIFSWDIDGIAWAIAMKIFFAIFGFALGILVLGFAIALSATLAFVSFPFIIVHNTRNDYADAL